MGKIIWKEFDDRLSRAYGQTVENRKKNLHLDNATYHFYLENGFSFCSGQTIGDKKDKIYV
jgi:hypothetical protein